MAKESAKSLWNSKKLPGNESPGSYFFHLFRPAETAKFIAVPPRHARATSWRDPVTQATESGFVEGAGILEEVGECGGTKETLRGTSPTTTGSERCSLALSTPLLCRYW